MGEDKHQDSLMFWFGFKVYMFYKSRNDARDSWLNAVSSLLQETGSNTLEIAELTSESPQYTARDYLPRAQTVSGSLPHSNKPPKEALAVWKTLH